LSRTREYIIIGKSAKKKRENRRREGGDNGPHHKRMVRFIETSVSSLSPLRKDVTRRQVSLGKHEASTSIVALFFSGRKKSGRGGSTVRGKKTEIGGEP